MKHLNLMALGFVTTLILSTAAHGASVFTSTGSLGTGRYNHTATLLPNGQVLVAAGQIFYHGLEGGTFIDYLDSAELYDPATGTWSPTGSLNLDLSGNTATLLANGKILFAGGNSELYESFLNPIINPVRWGDGSFQFGFINPSGPSYHVLASTDFAAPLNTWSNLGPATDTPPGSGQFQFTDHQATNYPQRFYRVSSP